MKSILKPVALSEEKKFWFIILFSILSFLLIPDFIIRIVITCYIGMFIFDSINEIKKERIFLLLFAFWCLAYVYVPYWNSPQTVTFKIASIIFLFAFGLFWAYQASSYVKLHFKPRQKLFPVILGVMIYIVNYRPLKADIPWKGDEDYHINSIIALSKYIGIIFRYVLDLLQKNIFFLPLAVILSVMILRSFLCRHRCSSYKKIAVLFSLSLFPILGIVFSQAHSLESITWHALRYPLIQKWFSLFFVFPEMYEDIALYRLVPFLSVILLAWFLFYKFYEELKKKWSSLFLSFTFSTIPLLYFYSSLLYLEMPIVLLMTICLFDLKSLISLKYNELLTKPSWYCLLLISFLKETVLVFLVIIIGARLIYQVKQSHSLNRRFKIILYELKGCFLVLSPFFIYLVFRLCFLDYRHYGMEFHNLINLSNYAVLINALFDQFGLFLIIGAAGFLTLLRKDKYIFVVITMLLVGTVCFFIADGIYIGYSRWSLFLLPILLFTGFNFVLLLKRYYHIGIIVALAVSNMALCPIHIDGVRLPNWGSPRIDLTERIYPYEEAIKWLSSEGNSDHLLVMGHYYPYYGLSFYCNKYKFYPRIEEWKFGPGRLDTHAELYWLNTFFRMYSDIKNESIPDGDYVHYGKLLLSIDTIIYHSVNNIDLDRNLIYGDTFKIIKKISNAEHSLYILRKKDLK